jgi:ElaB/YqjD/DUF883 family membrane-anchored ribosome-binding protein
VHEVSIRTYNEPYLTAIVLELEAIKEKYEGTVASLRFENDDHKRKATELSFELDQLSRTHESDMADLARKHRHELEDVREHHRFELEKLQRAASDDEESARKDSQKQLDYLRINHLEEVAALETKHQAEVDHEKVRL